MPLNQLSIFRIKSGVRDPDKILDDRWRHRDVPIRADRRLIGVLYVRPQRSAEPHWVSYFGSNPDLAALRLRTSTAAAVLLVERPTGTFALVFGYGRSMLKDEVIERRFGFKATLNAIEPNRIRAIDHKRLDAVPRHTREQVTKASGLEQFGLDVERDMLRAVTGTPNDATFGAVLSGGDHLVVLGDIPLERLLEKLDLYSELAAQSTYKKEFPFVDNIAEVRDTARSTRLDELLIRAINTGQSDHIWVGAPEVLEWADVSGFRYRGGKDADVYPDLVLDDYLASWRSRGPLTAERLAADRVTVLFGDDDGRKKTWSIYNCLIAEIADAGEEFVLSDGRWYRIDPAFIAQVNATLAAIPTAGIKLPRYTGGSERQYNERAARKSNGELHLLDGDLVHLPPHGKVEICDLYSARRMFIHVKRYSSSAPLSHLFAQGFVSAQLLLHEARFRQHFHGKLPAHFRWGDPAQSIDPAEFEVSFAIIPPKGKPLALPFFSRVTLRNTERLLAGYGFRVSLASVSHQ